MSNKSDISRDAWMLKGPLARRGYDWWWHSFTAENAQTGETKPFYVEFFTCNPGRAKDDPVIAWNLPEGKKKHDGGGRRVVVAGAGPAGLMAAETLARRGFAVTVLEKAKKPGGQVNTAAECLLKDKLGWCVEDLMTSVKKLGVKVKTGAEADAETIAKLDPYAVVVATGGVPVVPRSIPGVGGKQVCTAPDIIHGRVKLKNQRVVVVGSGMTGLETSEILCRDGNQVTIIEMADDIAPGNWFQLTDDELERLRPEPVEFHTGRALTAILPDGVLTADNKTGKLYRFPADSVVLSMPQACSMGFSYFSARSG